MRTRGLGEGRFSYTWSFPICPHRVSIGLSIIEALQQELVGTELRQGLLFGQTGPGVTQIEEWRTLPALDQETFAETLPSETRQAVGYYCIREGSSFILSPAEVALAQEFFRKPGSVVLLIERRKKGPAEASFFFWRGDTFVHNLPLPFPFHAGILSGETPGLADVPNAPPVRLPMRLPVRGRLQRRALQFGLYGATALAAGGLLAAIFHDRREMPALPAAGYQPGPPSAAAVWISTQPKLDLELTWDRHTESVLMATAGVLKIEDAGTTRQMSLDAGELLLGAILYAPASDRIRVELTTLQRDGRMAPVAVAAQPAPPSYAAPVAASSPPATNGGPVAEADRRVDLVTKKAAPPDVRPVLKRYVPTGAAPAVPEAAHDALPSVSPAVLTAALPPASVVIPAPLPAPPPKAAPPPARAPVPRSGRLIWTGTLARAGIVELDGRSASVGSLNGALPGAPVNLSITPAEFGPDGLVVYTTDASRHNRMEPASAGTGWNRVTFVWDPERVRQISVLEAPNPNNGFNRLALRNDARRCSMILIDWTLR
jgi:hypothetical protein